MIINDGPEQFGRQRLTPSFRTEINTGAVGSANDNVKPDHGIQSDNSGSQLPISGTRPIEAYSLPVEDVLARMQTVGISKSKDTVQRYCREGTLNCIKLGMLRRFYATQESVDVLIENLLQETPANNGMQPHAAADGLKSGDMQVHAASGENCLPEKLENSGTESNLHAGMASSVRLREAARSSDLDDFYKEQIRIKDDQLRVKDEQIAALLERDRETNILVRELQGLVSKTFSLLPGVQNEQNGDVDSGTIV